MVVWSVPKLGTEMLEKFGIVLSSFGTYLWAIISPYVLRVC